MNQPKIHMRSKDGSGLCLAYRCYQERLGEVSASIIETKGHCQEQYSGMLPIFNKGWEKKIDQETVVVYDQIGNGEEAEELKAMHIPVIGAGTFHDQLELDRFWCMRWLDEHGIRTPETHVFNDFEKARDFIKAQNCCLVFKPSGELPPDTTYMSATPNNEDLLFHLDKLEHLSKGAEFLLQKVVKGVEISSEVWYYKGVPLLPHNHTFEEKKSLNDNLGPSTGCAGNVVLTHQTPCFIYDSLFKPIEADLKVAHYTGVLDWNAIYTPEEGRLYVIEATSRFGYDAIQALCSLSLIPLTELFWKWGRGELESLPLRSDLSLGVRVTIPLEIGSKDAPEGEYIGGIDGVAGYWFSDVKMDKGRLVTAGWDGNILTATSTSPDIKIAQALLYSGLKKLVIGGKSYRTDIGNRFKEDWELVDRANQHYIEATKEMLEKRDDFLPQRKKHPDDSPRVAEPMVIP